jgi:hypothetical protein
VLSDIEACRTATMGGHVEQCDRCGHRLIAYNSCRNRHCPKCQATARIEWLAARESELLPVPYFHVVFTVPHELAAVALQNKRVVYEILFRTAAETLQQVAANPKHLGAQIGMLSVLHTWGQNLNHHPHVHCVIPAGGIAPDGSRWIPCRPLFFLPVKVLSRLFRGKFLARLREAFHRDLLAFHGELARLKDATAFRSFLSPLHSTQWVVYAKPPFGGPSHVLKYLARYTHRVAIANSRLLDLTDTTVSFRWKDYAHGGKRRVMTLSGVEFLRRFLLHVLPRAFVRIRYYGFLANRDRAEKIDRCRQLIREQPTDTQTIDDAGRSINMDDSVAVARRCPACKSGTMAIISVFAAGLDNVIAPVSINDTS